MANQTLISSNRVRSIDILRGLVMVIMALDHTRDFFHIDAFQHNPLDPQTTTVPLFFTRWITHFCAPVFVLLAGTSAYLAGLKRTRAELGFLLIKRGCWLILLEASIMTLILTFNPFFNTVLLGVIWAIGFSMVILGLLIYLPYPALLIIGLCIVFGHNLMDYQEAAAGFKPGILTKLLHGRFFIIHLTNGYVLAIIYAFMPWTGVLILGYCLGKLFDPAVESFRRKKVLIFLGLLLIVLFIVLRSLNHYGDPFPWSTQRQRLYTFLSFLNVNKYPPSLLFICVTLGPALILLGLIEGVQNKISSIFIVYGRVPLFYYAVHFFMIHSLNTLAFFLSGFGTKDIVSPQSFFLFRPPEFGFDLWVVYAIWIAVVLLMYPLCKWFGKYKATHRRWWLSYL